MNNLIEIMHKIHCGIDARLEGKSADVVLAEETKKIAIEFVLWKSEQPIKTIKLSDYSDIADVIEIYRIELEKEFEQFIEEYYE